MTVTLPGDGVADLFPEVGHYKEGDADEERDDSNTHGVVAGALESGI